MKMKKYVSLALVIAISSTLAMGCSKKEEQVDNTQVVEENNNEEQEVVQEKVEDINYIIYTRHKTIPIIFGESYTIPENDKKLENKTIEQVALEHLIAFEEIGDLISPIPSGTKVLSISKEGNTVTVDLSNEFIENMRNGEENAKVAIAAIVNTLTVIEGNEKAIITVEGKVVKNVNGAKLDEEFVFIEDFFDNK